MPELADLFAVKFPVSDVAHSGVFYERVFGLSLDTPVLQTHHSSSSARTTPAIHPHCTRPWMVVPDRRSPQ